MAMRMSSKDGRAPRNLLEGTGNLKQRYYKDKSFQENLRASQARVEQANLEAESATRLADRVDTAKNFGRSVFDFIKAAPKYIVGSTGAVLADSPFSPLRGQIRSIKIGDTEFLTPSARFQAGQELIGQGQYKQGIREIGTGALDIASTVAAPLKSLQALRVGKFGKAFLTGAVPTGLFGAGYQGLESFGADKTPAEIAKESAYAGAVSFGAGGFFGLGLAGLGKGGEMIAKRLGRGEKITPAEIAKITSESVPEKAQEVKPPVKTVDKKAETTAPKEETVSFYHRGENKATLHGGDWVDGDLKTHEGRAPADNITHIEIPKSQVSKYIREVSPEHSKEKVFRIKDGEMIPPEYVKRNDFLKKQGVSFDKPNTKASQASDDPLIQPAIEGTGDLVERGVARSLRDRAVAEGMDDFDVPSYRQMDMKEKAKKANDMMDTDPERVRRIAMRQEEAPAGDPPEAYFLAMENQILGSKNPETMVSDIIELSQSRIIEEATAMGQRNAMWAARAETSPTAIINKLTKERTGKAVKSVKKEVDEMRKAVRKTVKTAFNVDAAQKLLDKLKC